MWQMSSVFFDESVQRNDVLSTSVGSRLHRVTPPPSRIVTSQDVRSVAMSKYKSIFNMAAAGSARLFETMNGLLGELNWS